MVRSQLCVPLKSTAEVLPQAASAADEVWIRETGPAPADSGKGRGDLNGRKLIHVRRVENPKNRPLARNRSQGTVNAQKTPEARVTVRFQWITLAGQAAEAAIVVQRTLSGSLVLYMNF